MLTISAPVIKAEEISEVVKVLKSGNIAEGHKVKEFESAFADLIKSKFAVATNTGTAALHMALLAHNIGPGDEVITTPFSFVATASSILMTGAKPVFVDINSSLNINPDEIEKAITSKTKAILPVHLFGLAADMDLINKIAIKHKLVVIEDAAQAHGAKYSDGSLVGSKNTSCFSLYATKNITTAEGGIITTNNEKIYQKLLLLKNHGSRKKYCHEILGFNYRMTDIAAAIGVAQLKIIKGLNSKRMDNALFLSKALNLKGIDLPVLTTGRVFHQYTIRINKDFPISRDRVIEILVQNNVQVGIFYPIPIHKQPLFKNYKNNFSLKKSEKASEEVISLPIHPLIDKKDLKKIAEIFKSLLS